MQKEINMIVAIGIDGAIGRNGDLIWKIPADLKRFKQLTLGHPVIMGRKTWDSLPKKPLPGRRNIVLTKRNDFQAEGCEVADSFQKAIEMSGDETPFIIGGVQIYNEALPFISNLYLTSVLKDCEDADAFLHIDLSADWDKIEESEVQTTPEGLNFKYETFRRKPKG